MRAHPTTALSRIAAAGIVSAAILCAAPAAAAGAPGHRERQYAPGEVLVKFRAGTPASAKAGLLSASGARSTGTAAGHGLLRHLKLGAGQDTEAAVAAYRGDPNVEYAQPNYLYHATATVPDDGEYGRQWGLSNGGQVVTDASYATHNPGTAGADLDAESVWDYITDCSPVIVAVLDTGINYTHSDLAANMWDGGPGYPNHGWDFVDDDNDPIPSGAHGHGTHVAGIIGAVGNNAQGTAGLCWQARIMSVRVLDSDGVGSTANIIQGIEFAVDRGAKIINMSLGGERSFDQAFYDAITYARSHGAIVIAAAGNGGSDGIGDDNDGDGGDGDPTTALCPCNFDHDNLLCVAALDQAYDRANFSNYGATSVDIGAPGTNIHSTWPGPTIGEDFSLGWSSTGNWGHDHCDTADGPADVLVNPSDRCAGGTYLDDADDRAWKAFDLSGALGAKLHFKISQALEPTFDFARAAYWAGDGDPFQNGGTPVYEMSGPNSYPAAVDVSLAGCLTAACTVGFQLTSDHTITSYGVAVYNFELHTTQSGSTTRATLNGTSMATPHVTGLAALLWAYNPDYTYQDVITAIKNGGEAVPGLANITTTGRAANAYGALRYISPPTGVTVSAK